MDAYDETKVVGRGGFGEAVLCRRKSDAKTCIVKKVNVSTLPPKARKEAAQEALLLRALTHPGIVGFLDCFLHGSSRGILCIVMDYAAGGDLAGYLKRAGSNLLNEELVLDWFVQMTRALEHIHGRKILHRDLKPSNIFLTSSMTIKLGDFGIAKVLKHTLSRASTQIGTPMYMSPETISHRPYDHKADMWSLGCVLYEMVCLKVPFTNFAKLLRENPPPIPSRYGRELQRLVRELLQKRPDDRPSTGTVLKRPFIKDAIQSMAERHPDRSTEESAAAAAAHPAEGSRNKSEEDVMAKAAVVAAGAAVAVALVAPKKWKGAAAAVAAVAAAAAAAADT